VTRDGVCNFGAELSWGNIAFSAATDLYLAVYPAVVLAKLQLNFKKKLALSGALGIGSMYVFCTLPYAA